jgi:hypothetical protein
MHSEKARVLMAVNELNKKEMFVQKSKGLENLMDEILQLTKKFAIDTVVLYKKTIIFVTSQIEKKSDIMELSVLTKDYNMLFFSKKDLQERFMEDKDLQKYRLVLYNVDIYLNIISEISEKLLVAGLMQPKSGKSEDAHDKR